MGATHRAQLSHNDMVRPANFSRFHSTPTGNEISCGACIGVGDGTVLVIFQMSTPIRSVSRGTTTECLKPIA
jgi:hypothetical protein